MNKNLKESSTGSNSSNTIKRSRGFIFFMGFLILALSIYMYSFQNIWLTIICASVGISLILIAIYAKKKVIHFLENLMTGWP